MGAGSLQDAGWLIRAATVNQRLINRCGNLVHEVIANQVLDIRRGLLQELAAHFRDTARMLGAERDVIEAHGAVAERAVFLYPTLAGAAAVLGNHHVTL